MLSKSFGLHFYLKKRNDYVAGPLPIYLRITVDGQRAEVSTKRICDDLSKWNVHSGRMSGTKESTKVLNVHLSNMETKVHGIYSHLFQQGETITAEIIKNKLLGVTDRPRMILEIFQAHNDQVKALIGNGYAPLTHQRYETALQHTRSFIQWKYNLPDLEITKLTFEFISDFEFYLKTACKCGHNTTMKYLKNFKKIVLLCVKRGWLSRDPFGGFNLATKDVAREFLSQEEIDKIVKKTFVSERVTVARDIFIFSCYTGLAYIDVYNLKRSDIRIGIDGQKWIFAYRQKTETPFRVPLLPVPLEILERYKNHPRCVNEDKALPVRSNQKLNEYLKDIADLCGIEKRLTYHIARHTFATTILLNNGVPIETVSKILGHKYIKVTQHYAKILDFKVSQDMEVLKAKFEKGTSDKATEKVLQKLG